MIDVFTLLSLPQTSNGFSALKFSSDEGSDSHARKTPRLDNDLDSASASRTKENTPSERDTGTNTKPVLLKLVGRPVLPQLEPNAALRLLNRCIKIILNRDSKDVLPATYEDIFSACWRVVCLENNGEDLYGTVKLEMEQCVSRLSNALAQSSEKGLQWVVLLVSACSWFINQVALLISLLTYLNQSYVCENKGILTIRDLSFDLFSMHILQYVQIVDKLRTGVKEWIDWERTIRLKHDSRPCIRELISHLQTFGQYPQLEDFYITTTRKYYELESKERADTLKNDPKAFFKHVHIRIEEEIQRCEGVLPIASWSMIRDTTQRALLAGRLEWLARQALGPYIEAKDAANLSIMYRLFARVDGLDILRMAFRTFVTISVQKIVKDPAHDDSMVQRLLDFKALVDEAISKAFVDEVLPASDSPSAMTSSGSSSAPPPLGPNIKFAYALSEGFQTGFKTRRNKPAEMIAKYLDKAMRKGQGASSDEEFEKGLDSVLNLYRYTEDKDVFRTFYHRSLAKRLLLEKSASDDFEKSMLKKLKEKYDAEFGMAEDMFKDLALSREMMREYHSRMEENTSGRKLNVMVLQRSAWPFTVSKKGVDLPPDMQAELTKFTRYYKEKHQGHVLDWDHALGTVILKATFNTGVKELSVSLYQAIVLLLFNESTEIPLADIAAQTRMEDGELRRTLQSLACGKKKVLRKVPPGRDVDNQDVFRFNPDFDDPHPKVHINSIQAKVSPEESRRTQLSVEGDRKHYLDAAIVRIMKAKKELTYEQLKTATIDAVKSHFVPDIASIKQRIDSLVESDYLKRDEKDMNLFRYVA